MNNRRTQQLFRKFVLFPHPPTNNNIPSPYRRTQHQSSIQFPPRQWQSTVAPNTVLYSTLIKGFAAAKNAKQALAIYHEMRAAGVARNGVTFNSVIDACARTGECDAIHELLKEMQAEELPLDLITLSTIIKGYSTSGKMQEALMIFRSMKGRDKKSDAIIYNTLLDGFVRHGQFDVADQLISELEAAGGGGGTASGPAPASGGGGGGRRGTVDREVPAHFFFERESSCQTNGKNGFGGGNVLAAAFPPTGGGGGGVNLPNTSIHPATSLNLLPQDFVPSNFTLTILIRMWGKRRNLFQAFRAVEKYPREYGIRINAHVVTCLISACLSNDAVDTALRAFWVLVRVDVGLL